MDQPESVIIKFNSIDPNALISVKDHLNSIVGKDVFKNAQQMFPDEQDKNLASIYVANVEGSPEITQIIDSLNDRQEIDYAHLPSSRASLK